MSAESLSQPAANLYEEDFVAWALDTARLLREGRFNAIDIENLAEEVEAMAGRDKRELLSRLTVLILHLLKWRWQPEKRSGSWAATIVTQRTEIEGLFEQSPSLRRTLSPSLSRVYRNAVKEAAAETGLPQDTFPRQCPFSAAQVLDEEFLPGP